MTTTMSTYDRWRAGRRLLAARRPLDAVRVLEPAVTDEPEAASLHLLLARAYLASAQWRRAQGSFRRAVEIDPTDPYAHFALARTLEHAGQTDGARRHRSLARALDPSYDAAERTSSAEHEGRERR